MPGYIWHGPGRTATFDGKRYVEVAKAHKRRADEIAAGIRANGGTARVRFWGASGAHDLYQVLQGPRRSR